MSAPIDRPFHVAGLLTMLAEIQGTLKIDINPATAEVLLIEWMERIFGITDEAEKEAFMTAAKAVVDAVAALIALEKAAHDRKAQELK